MIAIEDLVASLRQLRAQVSTIDDAARQAIASGHSGINLARIRQVCEDAQHEITGAIQKANRP